LRLALDQHYERYCFYSCLGTFCEG
jgi:hypothetical protein